MNHTMHIRMKIRHWIKVVGVEGKEFKVECYGVDYRTRESHWPPRNIFIFWHGFGQMGFATPSHLNVARPHLFREIHCQFSQVYAEQVFVSVGVEPVYPMGRKRPFFEDEARAVIQALDLEAEEGTLSEEIPTVRVVGYSTGGVMAGTLGYLLGAKEVFLFGGAGLCDLQHGVPELAWSLGGVSNCAGGYGWPGETRTIAQGGLPESLATVIPKDRFAGPVGVAKQGQSPAS